MKNKNKHIEKYLDYYCDNENIASFAILLKGKWGCGKTYFIKNFINDKFVKPERDVRFFNKFNQFWAKP